MGGSPGSCKSLGIVQVASLEDHGAGESIGLAVNICHFYLAHGSISIGLLSDFAVRGYFTTARSSVSNRSTTHPRQIRTPHSARVAAQPTASGDMRPLVLMDELCSSTFQHASAA